MKRAGSVAARGIPWVCLRCRAFTTAPSQRAHWSPDQRERRPSQRLPTSPARTRFAPSPTGYLHLGSLRTALYNFLLAKATGGQFLLRIEDTDQTRTVDDAEEKLCQDLKWAGLQWDEGPDIGGSCGPYKQSERTALYREHTEKLLQSGHAYRCFCPSDRTSQQARLAGPNCSTISKEQLDKRVSGRQPHVVRLKMPDGPVPTYTDLVYGEVGPRGGPRPSKASKKIVGQMCYEDLVLMKSDGFPTYHLANVVDDHHMKITHVIRAAEWMPSTPKHNVMYQAFGWQPPLYAHVGLLQNNERQKYSKRKGDVDFDMRSLRKKGVFPETLLNYVALHGWSHDLGDDVLRFKDLIENFDLRFTKGNTVIEPNKLDYLQKRYAEKYVEEGGAIFNEMIERTLAVVEAAAADRNLICPAEEVRPRLVALLRLQARQYAFPQQFFDRNSYFFYPEPRQHDYHQHIHWLVFEHLYEIKDVFTRTSSGDWNVTSLNERLAKLNDLLSKAGKADSAERNDLKRTIGSQLQSFLRWAVSYGRPGPAIAQTMEILGRDVTLKRVEDAVATFENPTQKSGVSTP